jgi:repressor LexA
MARPVETELTKRQKQILAAIYKVGQGSGVLLADLVRALKAPRETSVVPTVERIAARGYLEITGGGSKGKPRVLELTARARAELGVLPGVPRIGIVAAGAPGGAVLDEVQYIQCSLHPTGRKYGYLEISGDSLSREGVLPGDQVLVEKISHPSNGQIVAVCITRAGHSEFTLKYFHCNPETGTIALVPNSYNRQHKVLLLADTISAADYRWVKRVAAAHRPVSQRSDIECIPPARGEDSVTIPYAWREGLIRPYRR